MTAALRTLALLLAAFAFCFGARAEGDAPAGYDPAFVMADGDQERAWVLTRALDGRDRSITLFQAPERLRTGSLRMVAQIAGTPEALCAAPGALIAVFPPTADARPLRRVRAYEIVDLAGRELVEGASPMPPLPGVGALVSITHTQGALFALLHDEEHTLLRRVGSAWEPVELAAELANRDAGTLRLAPGSARLTLAERAGAALRLWVLEEDAWAVTARVAAPSDDARLISVNGRRLLAHEDGDAGAFVVSQPGEDVSSELFRVPLPESGAHAVTALANTLVVLHPIGGGTTDVRMRVVDLTGETLYDDNAQLRGPVSAADIQTLALAMAALGLMVVVFIVRPGMSDREPALPDGWVLATPLRRTFGVLLDLLPGVAAVFLIWPEYLTQPQEILSTTGAAGPWALGTVVIQLIALGTLGEALFGRTLGKALTGMRTIDYDGKRPTLWMAFSRNVIRALCPPLAVFSAINPTMPHPASFQTLVVVKRRA